MPVNNLIQLRKGNSSTWSSQNPVLASGEPGYDLTNNILKVGDGVTPWNNLSGISTNLDTSLAAGSGIIFAYADSTLTISTSGGGGGGGLNNVVEDITPQLGGNLDLNSYSINGTGNISISGNVIANTGSYNALTVNSISVSLSGHTHTASDITNFNEAVDDRVGSGLLVAGTGIGLNYNDTANTLTINVTNSPRLVTTVFNKTGSTIPKFRAVYINGGQGDQPTITLAANTGDATSAATYGVTSQAIDNMSTGEVVVFGALTGINTDQFNPSAPMGNVNGTILYLSNASGIITSTKPYAPNHIVTIGTIVRTHQNEGVVEVRIQNGFELEEIHDVSVTGVTNGQFLQYNSSNDLWIPSSSGNFTTLQVNGTAVPTGTGSSNYLTKWTSTNSLNKSIIYDNGTNIGIGTTSPTFKLDVVGTGNFSQNLLVNGTGVSLSGHTHSSSDITNFNSSVSGLLPVKNIIAGSNVSVSSTSGNFTISTTGLQPSGNYSEYGHTHLGDDISIFNSNGDSYTLYAGSNGANFLARLIDGNIIDGFEYLLTDNIPIPNTYLPTATASGLGIVQAGSGVSISSGIISVNTNYASLSHTHNSSDITNFNSSVSGLLPVNNITAGSGISISASSGNYTINVDVIDCGQILAPPNAPTALSATSSNASLVLSWTAPTYAGSTAITGYIVEYTPSGGSASTVNTNSTSTSYTLSGLTNGTSYSVRVRAINSIGNGSYSSSVSSIPSIGGLTVLSALSNAGSYTGAGTLASPISWSGNYQLQQSNIFTVNSNGTLYINVTNELKLVGDYMEGAIWYKNNIQIYSSYYSGRSYNFSTPVNTNDTIKLFFELSYGGGVKAFTAYVS